MALIALDPESVLKKFSTLQEQRRLWDSHWQEIAELVWPQVADFTIEVTPGSKRQRKVFDPSAELALESFAAVLESLLTPRAQKWHRLKASNKELDEQIEVRRWFEAVTDILFSMRDSPKANYYSQKHAGYKSLGAFGNESLFVGAHPEGGILYRNNFIGRVWTEINDRGLVDTNFYKFPMSAKAAVQMYGEDRLKRLAPKVSESLTEQPFRLFDFLSVTFPRLDGFDPERADAKGMRFQTLDLSIEDKSIVNDGGFAEMPYLYSRYTVSPNERLGRGPAMTALPAINVLQEMEKTHLRAGHKVADPPLLVHDDGVMGTGSQAINLRPGGINIGGVDSQGRALIQPLQTNARLDITTEMMEQKRRFIDDVFLVPLHKFLEENPTMTATQALMIAQQRGMLQAPAVGRQQSEMLGPQVEREINILQRQNLLPEMPPVLVEAEGEYEIEYETQATRTQKSDVVIGFQRTMEIAAPLIQLDPANADIFNPKKVLRLVAEANGVPSDAMRTDEELEALEAQRAQQQQRQQMLEAAPVAASAAKDLAQAQEAVTPA